MSVLRWCATAACVLACAGQAGAGQRGAAPPQGAPGGTPPIDRPARDTREQRPGTAVIRGRVVTADTGSPVRRAQVRLTSSAQRENRMTSTDDEGRYEFRTLPAGSYTLSVSKAGYVTLQYGQRRPFEAGRPLDVAEGEALDKVDFGLPRGCVIAGRVTDEYGEPVADAMVQAMRYQYVGGQRRLVSAGRTAVSDDIGQFRIFGLPPGSYLVSATLRTAAPGANTDDVSGYAPTYYPGTGSVGEAQRLSVAIGEELLGIGFALLPARLARVGGTVVSSQGLPLGGSRVMLRPAVAGPMVMLNVGGGGGTRADGSFTLSNVPPGEYVLEVRARPREMVSGGVEAESASVPLTVTGDDISGLTVVTSRGATVSGRVVFEGGSPPSSSSGRLQVIASSAVPDTVSMGRQAGDGRVGDNGSFELRGLSGPRLIRVSNLPSGWALKAVTLNGSDITDSPYEFRGEGMIAGLEVTLTNRLTDLSGTVTDSRDQPVRDYTVVVFPDDPAGWRFQSRFIRTGRPDQDGRFSIRGLPPARYLAVALDFLEQGSENDPEFLEQLRQSARSFSLADGQMLSLDLEPAVGP